MRKFFYSILLILTFFILTGFKNVDDGKEIRIDNKSNIYLVGDSRTYCGYLQTADDRVNWLACPGTKYDYFKSEYLPLLSRQSLRGKTIVILYGVNDLMNDGIEETEKHWMHFFNHKAQNWIRYGANVKVCSVMGLDYGVSEKFKGIIYRDSIDAFNDNVAEYNKFLVDNLPDNIEYIQLEHHTTPAYEDGIHYTFSNGYYIYEGLIERLLENQ